jgi:hypothetical protein
MPSRLSEKGKNTVCVKSERCLLLLPNMAKCCIHTDCMFKASRSDGAITCLLR